VDRRGRVAVDGKKIQTPDAWVDPEHQRVTLDGKPLRATKKIYLLLYKPKGYVTPTKIPMADRRFTICSRTCRKKSFPRGAWTWTRPAC